MRDKRDKIRRLRVCVCTSVPAVAEPRAPRHAAAVAQLGRGVEVIFVDSAPAGAVRRSMKMLEEHDNLTWCTHRFASRSTNPLRLAVDRARQKIAQVKFTLAGGASPGALSVRAFGLQRMLQEVRADVYLAHNIDTLLPVCLTAQSCGALAMFDSMEFHSDMGDGQTATEKKLIQTIEKECLPACALVLASSDQVAHALTQEYGIPRPLALYNTPPVAEELPRKSQNNLALYWRNSVIGLGQRGLDDALVALTRLRGEIALHLQGRLGADGGVELRSRISALGLSNRVVFHEPYAPEDAVSQAARHHVGLCLERKGVRNHDLTVSNKIFDYHMAGLAVIASDLPGLHAVLERSGGGMLFLPGSVEDLTKKILALYNDRVLLNKFATSAREFALREANRDMEMSKFVAAFTTVCRERLGVRLVH